LGNDESEAGMGRVCVQAQGEGGRSVATETEPCVLDRALESVISWGEGAERC
jgi:hypothetical protein